MKKERKGFRSVLRGKKRRYQKPDPEAYNNSIFTLQILRLYYRFLFTAGGTSTFLDGCERALSVQIGADEPYPYYRFTTVEVT